LINDEENRMEDIANNNISNEEAALARAQRKRALM